MHLIRKQIMHIKTTSVEGAYALQQEAGRYFRSQVLPALEKLFDAVNTDDEVVVLDHVEIDLGVLTQNGTDQFVSESELYPLIQKQFEDYLRSERYKESIGPVAAPPGHSKKKTPALHAFDQWLYYMQQGVLPWNVTSVGEKMHQQVLEVLATDSTAVSHLTKCIQEEPGVSIRIVREHVEPFLVKLVEGITGEKQTDLPVLLLSLEELLKGGSNQQTQEELWHMVIQEVVKKERVKNTQALVKELCRVLLPLKNQTDQHLFATSEKWPLLKGILSALTTSSMGSDEKQVAVDSKKKTDTFFTEQKREIKNETVEERTSERNVSESINGSDAFNVEDKSVDTEKNSPLKIKDALSFPANEKKIAVRSQAGENSSDLIPSQSIDSQTQSNDLQNDATDFQASSGNLLEEGIFVKNAGLILLHPFFQFLFRNTGLSKGLHFTDRYAQQQAIYLLHYIATGETKAQEHQLPIPKLICGWSITEPVLKDVALTGSMLQEADDLVRAAIAQWSILKNTSVEGLRESFLQREGKVFTKSDKIYIHVEKSSIDILLDHLPWNTSIVKFPWFKEILWVEWR